MFKPKLILLPTDFSHYAQFAMGYAVGMAKAYDAKIHLLHVLDSALFSRGSGQGLWLTKTDAETLRESMRDARSTLEQDLSKVLDDEQMEQFRQATRSRQRGNMAARLRQYDDNGDGKIQKSELPEGEGLEELFDRLDRNGDGELDAEELRGGRGGGRGGNRNIF